MGIKLGGSEVTMYAGSAVIKAAYIGPTKIWEKSSSSSGSGSGSSSGSGSGSAYSMRNIDELMDLVNE